MIDSDDEIERETMSDASDTDDLSPTDSGSDSEPESESEEEEEEEAEAEAEEERSEPSISTSPRSTSATGMFAGACPRLSNTPRPRFCEDRCGS